MRTRVEIEEDGRLVELRVLEVLLDIRAELLETHGKKDAPLYIKEDKPPKKTK